MQALAPVSINGHQLLHQWSLLHLVFDHFWSTRSWLKPEASTKRHCLLLTSSIPSLMWIVPWMSWDALGCRAGSQQNGDSLLTRLTCFDQNMFHRRLGLPRRGDVAAWWHPRETGQPCQGREEGWRAGQKWTESILYLYISTLQCRGKNGRSKKIGQTNPRMIHFVPNMYVSGKISPLRPGTQTVMIFGTTKKIRKLPKTTRFQDLRVFVGFLRVFCGFYPQSFDALQTFFGLCLTKPKNMQSKS